LSLRWVRSSHYCKIKHPYLPSKYVKKEIVKAKADGANEVTKSVKRWYVTYRPSIHPYIGHYDQEKYKKAMKKYKRGELKLRPNGRKWCKVRFNQAKGQVQSDLEKLMSKYNFDLQDLRNEIKEKEEDHRIRYEIF
jgi:hypothetical protein